MKTNIFLTMLTISLTSCLFAMKKERRLGPRKSKSDTDLIREIAELTPNYRCPKPISIDNFSCKIIPSIKKLIRFNFIWLYKPDEHFQTLIDNILELINLDSEYPLTQNSLFNGDEHKRLKDSWYNCLSKEEKRKELRIEFANSFRQLRICLSFYKVLRLKHYKSKHCKKYSAVLNKIENTLNNIETEYKSILEMSSSFNL